MFGSISNWVNTNIPSNMPTLPTVNMPHMPTIPGFLIKNKNSEEKSLVDENSVIVENKIEIVNEETSASSQISETSKTENSDQKNEDIQQEDIKVEIEEVKDTAEIINKAEQKSATKALESAKEIGSNFGSIDICNMCYSSDKYFYYLLNWQDMLFSFGKNATSNVKKTATQLKDVIEKKVPLINIFH